VHGISGALSGDFCEMGLVISLTLLEFSAAGSFYDHKFFDGLSHVIDYENISSLLYAI